MPKSGLFNRARRRRRRVLIEQVEPRILLADTLWYHGVDLTSNGVNPYEVQLTPGNVTVSSFGKQFTTDVRDTPYMAGIPSSVLNSTIDYSSPNGQVYPEPLVKTGVNITTGPFQGVHDVVLVATEMDSLFAIDANGGQILWKDSFVYNPSGNPNPLNPTIQLGVTPVPGGYGAEINTSDVAPWVGIMSTPWIDPAAGYIYLTTKTREVGGGDQTNPHFVYKLHKVRLSNGLDTSVVIADTTLGNANPSSPTYTYNSGPYVLGMGVGAISVGGQSRVYLNAVRQMQRPGLTINNGRLYVEFASHGDNQPYHGWVLTYDPSTLAINGALCTTPNSGMAGIWMGGGYGSFDPQGNLFVETGNGRFGGSNGNGHTGAITGLDVNGFPTDGSYGDCFLKISLDPTTTQGNQGTNKNGWGLKIIDYFAPFNASDLDGQDRDLGSSGPIVLPDSAGSAAHPHLLVGSGKEGKIYLIDRDDMGKFGNTDNVVQTIGSALNGALDTPAFFNGRIYYTSGYGGSGKSWLVSNGQINTATGVQTTPDGFVFPGSSPMISANGTLNGIAWMADKGGQLRAYDAADLSHELWNSSQNATRDSLGVAVKFAVATPVNGRVYVGTAGFLISYGPPIPPTSPPAAPSGLNAAATGAATISLSWTDNSSNEDGFKIERSTNGVNFTEIGASGVNQSNFLDSGLSSQTQYYYRVRAYNSFNSLSYSGYTNIANATTLPFGSQSPVDQYNFDEGSGTTTADSISFNTGTLVGATKPAWVAGRIGSGSLSFNGTGAYNQNNQSAVDLANNLAPILGGTSSIAFWIKSNQVGNNTAWSAPAVTGVEQTGGGNDIGWGFLDASGRIGIFVGDSGSVMSSTSINNGQWHHIAISRDASNGSIKLYVDGVLNKSGTLESGNKSSVFRSIGQLTIVNGDGTTRSGGNYFNGQLDDIRIYNQIIDPAQVSALAQAPAAPTNLIATAASGTELDLTWNDVATTETGYKIERAIAGGSFQQIQLLAANSTSYSDTGLLQGVSYSYRVRATNGAGDSAYSNTVTIVTPVPPITPSNAQTTFISATQIDLRWDDRSNNEDGFKILRRVGENQFAQIADVPPNTTTFFDNGGATGLTPGVSFDYHVQAYNVAGFSDFTGLTATTLAKIPTGVRINAGASDLLVSWSPAAGASSYNLYRSATRGGEGAVPFASHITATSFDDTTVNPGQFYYYQVTALNADDVESARSIEVSNDPSLAPAQLASPVSYPTGTNAHGVAAADVNGDGKPDMLVANAGSSTVSVLLGNGDGTFRPAVNYPVGQTPKTVAAKDLNGDGKLDLVTPNQDAGTISVLINKGDGTFFSKADYTGTAGAHDIALADLDGDNDIDIVEAGWGATVVRVLFNNGNGTFAGGTNYNVGTAPHSVVAVNFNADTKPDLAVADHGSNNVAILINNGNGTFAAATFYTVGTAPHAIRSADFNGDGKLDLTTANDGSDNLSVLLGNGDGTFASAVNYSAGSVPKGVAVGDINNDGRLDLISANTGGNYPSGNNPAGMTISVLLGNGNGTFAAATSFSTGNTPFSIAPADFDSDGDVDLATANWNSNDVTVLRNRILSNQQANQPPVANPDSASTIANQPVQINILANDTDADGSLDPTMVLITTDPVHGEAAVDPVSGLVTYTPDADYVGSDQFAYTVKDDRGAASSSANVSITINSAQPTLVYLSDLTPTSATNGWGPYEKDTSNGENGAGDGKTITLNGVTYAKGLGAHASSTIIYNLASQYSQFLCDVGVDDEVGNNGSVVFQVWLDSVKVYDSGTMSGAGAAQSVNLNVTGKNTLQLTLTDAANGNAFDHGDWANARVTVGQPVSPPAAPTGLNAVYNTATGKIDLSWTDASNDETGFRIERKIGAGGTYAQIADLAAGTQSYSDSNNLVPGDTYYYHVYAYKTGAANSSFSNEPSASVPIPPGNVYLSDLTPTSATNGWGPYEEDGSNGEAGAGDGKIITLNGVTYARGLGVHATSTIIYNLNGQYSQFLSDIGVDDEVGNNGSVVFQVWLDGVKLFDSGTMTGASATQSINLNVTGKATLQLTVTDAGNGNGFDHADWANARLIVGQPVPPPAAPTGLSAVFNSNHVDLAWTDASSDETGFRVERKLGAGGTWAAVQTLAAGTQAWTDNGPFASSSTYYYRVLAFNTGGDSSPSNEQNITTPVAPAQTYLSDLNWTSATNGWGPVEKDRSNGETGATDGKTITLNGVTYAKGLGVHATADITYSINSAYSTFISDIGVDDEAGNNGSVVFQVWLDGVKVFDSGTMTGASATQSINLSVTGKNLLRLVVTDAGNGNSFDHGDWAGARLIS